MTGSKELKLQARVFQKMMGLPLGSQKFFFVLVIIITIISIMFVYL